MYVYYLKDIADINIWPHIIYCIVVIRDTLRHYYDNIGLPAK